MMKLANKRIVFCVSGGIATYKAVDTVSKIVKQGANVDVVMTENATKFVSELTFQTISKNRVTTDMFKRPENWDTKHISLAKKADLIVIAPATANIIGKIASGIADDFLTTMVMAAKSEILFVPSMNSAMFKNRIFQDNVRKLKDNGMHFVKPEKGYLACGDTGIGRYPKTNAIIKQMANILDSGILNGKKILVTAGPTRENIDPVRFISNRSTGKMGYNFAKAAKDMGADVTIVFGPVSIKSEDNFNIINVNSAVDMYNQVTGLYKEFDILAFFAAVSDYRVKNISSNKIKKSNDKLKLELTKNPDIAKTIGKDKGNRVIIGSCAETENILQNAQSKLKNKNFDIIMANDVTEKGAGFGVDTNIVTLIDKFGESEKLPMMSKYDVSRHILNKIWKKFYKGKE